MTQLKKIATYIIITLLSGNLTAQKISVYGGGGLSTLNYKLSLGEQSNGFGGLVGARYSYLISNSISIGTGLELSLYNAKVKFNDFSTKQNLKDFDGTDFEFRSSLNSYEEKQTAAYVNIPLMVQYNFSRFYVSAGAKIGIPISGKYTPSGTIKNSGYYPDENYEYTEQDFLGFGTFNVDKKKKDINLNIAYMASMEAGFIWDINNISLYTGLYLDYGLNNVLKDKPDKELIDYNTLNPSDFKLNSVLNLQQGGKALTEKLSPMAVGLKISIVFGGEKVYSVRQPVYKKH